MKKVRIFKALIYQSNIFVEADSMVKAVENAFIAYNKKPHIKSY